MPLSCFAIPGRPFHFSDPAFSTHRRKKVIPWGGFLGLLKKPVYNWARLSGSPGSCSLDQEAPFWATFQYPEPEGQEAWQQTSFHAMTHDALWVELLTTAGSSHKTTGLSGSLNPSLQGTLFRSRRRTVSPSTFPSSPNQYFLLPLNLEKG